MKLLMVKVFRLLTLILPPLISFEDTILHFSNHHHSLETIHPSDGVVSPAVFTFFEETIIATDEMDNEEGLEPKNPSEDISFYRDEDQKLPEESYDIIGITSLQPSQLLSFAMKRNPELDQELVSLFLEYSTIYGIRGDYAFLQSCLETNFFRYGGDVKENQNNFGGLGTTGNGVAGHSFPTKEIGVLANIQHLYAYATTSPLPDGQPLVDPRFRYVKRGSAITIFQLSGTWASDLSYGEKIRALYLLASKEPQK